MKNAQAILVTQDPSCAEPLCQALDSLGVSVQKATDAKDAERRLEDAPADLLIVDFGDEAAATSLMEALRPAHTSASLLVVALLEDESKRALANHLGTHFAMFKPVSGPQIQAVLKATSVFMTRERRRSTRVPVQVPVILSWPQAEEVEGVLLDISEHGMDVMAAQAIPNFAELSFRFAMPDGSSDFSGKGSVAWSRGNGEAGVRFHDLAEAEVKKLMAWLRSSGDPDRFDQSKAGLPCKLTDLSLGGCYVETDAPLPVGTQLDLWLIAGEMQARAEGLVRVHHPAAGMGIEFLSATDAQKKAVEQFLDFLVSRPGVTPEMRVVPRDFLPFSAAAPTDALEVDPLLDLLRQQNDMPRAAFLAELQRQRSGETTDSQSAAASV
jgi:CheY-like chemotaxis protein